MKAFEPSMGYKYLKGVVWLSGTILSPNFIFSEFNWKYSVFPNDHLLCTTFLKVQNQYGEVNIC